MVGRTLNSRYSLEQLIGTGGMADVYRATDQLLGRTVAVKILHPQFAKDPVFIERFRLEAQAAANLNQPNVVNVYDWGIEDSTYYLVMEYVEGLNLKDIILRGGPLLPERAVEIAIAITGALEAAHTAGIVHRDIKPQNVICTSDDKVKVMDFGIARTTGGQAMTQTGTIMGTAQYISPEQAQGRVADPRSDLYSLGVVLYEMLTARVPFDGENPVSIAYKHVREDPLPPSMINPDVSPELEAVVMKALAKNPENRYRSAKEMRADLERSLEGSPVHATPVLPQDEAGATRAYVPAAVRAARPRRSRLWIIIPLVILILAGMGVGVWALVNATSGVKVPNLVGQSEANAKKLIGAAGLELGNVGKDFNPSVSKGLVASQDPSAGSKVSKGMRIDLVISKGPALVTVPDCRGLSQADAEARLKNANLKLGNVSEEFSTSVPSGKVSSQSPDPAAKVTEGTAVNLALSKGPETVTVPDLTGMTSDAAAQQLKSLGLSSSVTEVTDATKTPGTVASQEPRGGTKVSKGATVKLNVVTVPKQVNVPDVIGLDQSTANDNLTAAGFVVDARTKTTTDQSQVGKVLPGGQNPIGGTQADKGSTVTIFIGTL